MEKIKLISGLHITCSIFCKKDGTVQINSLFVKTESWLIAQKCFSQLGGHKAPTTNTKVHILNTTRRRSYTNRNSESRLPSEITRPANPLFNSAHCLLTSPRVQVGRTVQHYIKFLVIFFFSSFMNLIIFNYFLRASEVLILFYVSLSDCTINYR